jgi:hypothetical protein
MNTMRSDISPTRHELELRLARVPHLEAPQVGINRGLHLEAPQVG